MSQIYCKQESLNNDGMLPASHPCSRKRQSQIGAYIIDLNIKRFHDLKISSI